MGFENHPGHSAGCCPLRLTIKAHPWGTSRNGYSCDITGGHCLPGDNCARRRELAAARNTSWLDKHIIAQADYYGVAPGKLAQFMDEMADIQEVVQYQLGD